MDRHACDTHAAVDSIVLFAVVVEPSMWPTSPIRETQLHWLRELGEEASPVFWQSWFVYPHSGVAELQPGAWDFSQITPLLQVSCMIRPGVVLMEI